MTRSRIVVFSLVALVVAVSGGGALLWRQHQAAERAAASCAAIRADNTARDDGRPVVSGGPTAVILGDSYAQGQHLDRPREQAWSTLIGAQEGWTTYVNAVGGTGFVGEGPCGAQRFSSRVAAVLARNPQVVVVEGGLNDTAFTPDEVESSAGDLLRALATVPHIVVVGPTAPPARPDTAAIDNALRDATTAAGRTYVSAEAWTLPYLPDNLHLTVDGHRAFADLVGNGMDG